MNTKEALAASTAAAVDLRGAWLDHAKKIESRLSEAREHAAKLRAGPQDALAARRINFTDGRVAELEWILLELVSGRIPPRIGDL